MPSLRPRYDFIATTSEYDHTRVIFQRLEMEDFTSAHSLTDEEIDELYRLYVNSSTGFVDGI